MNLNRPDQWRNPIYAAGEPGITLVAMPRYQKPGVWCVRAAVRSEILLFFCDRRIANDRPRGARFFRNFQWLLRNTLTPPSPPFSLIYRLEHISEQDSMERLTPASRWIVYSRFKYRDINQQLCSIPKIYIYINTFYFETYNNITSNVNQCMRKSLPLRLTSPPYISISNNRFNLFIRRV